MAGGADCFSNGADVIQSVLCALCHIHSPLWEGNWYSYHLNSETTARLLKPVGC